MFVHAKVQEPAAKTLRVTLWVAITAVVAFALLAATGGSRSVLASTTIHQTLPISSGAAGFQASGDDCSRFDLEPGEIGWHFVLTQTSAPIGTVLNVQFDNGSFQQWNATRKTGGVLHWYVITSGASQLTGANTPASGGNLNLSHICNGGPGSSSSSNSSTT